MVPPTDLFLQPAIEANWGDIIDVTVHNEIAEPEEGTAFHWYVLLRDDEIKLEALTCTSRFRHGYVPHSSAGNPPPIHYWAPRKYLLNIRLIAYHLGSCRTRRPGTMAYRPFSSVLSHPGKALNIASRPTSTARLGIIVTM